VSPHRCQLCGRRKGLRKDGTIVHHFVGGDKCPGAGHPPIEESDARLIEVAAQLSAAFDRVNAEIRALQDRRANFIDPALIHRRGALAAQSLKVNNRLHRHRTWADRYVRTYDRHMMTQGYVWADKPPPYLISRYIGEKGWTPEAFR
jgi:hypothetical protein